MSRGRNFDDFNMILSDREMVAYARRLAHLCVTHDPCATCGHGRLLHKKQAYRDAVIRARDEALPEKQCRRGIEQKDGGCACLEWIGTETPFPERV